MTTAMTSRFITMASWWWRHDDDVMVTTMTSWWWRHDDDDDVTNITSWWWWRRHDDGDDVRIDYDGVMMTTDVMMMTSWRWRWRHEYNVMMMMMMTSWWWRHDDGDDVTIDYDGVVMMTSRWWRQLTELADVTRRHQSTQHSSTASKSIRTHWSSLRHCRRLHRTRRAKHRTISQSAGNASDLPHRRRINSRALWPQILSRLKTLKITTICRSQD